MACNPDGSTKKGKEGQVLSDLSLGNPEATNNTHPQFEHNQPLAFPYSYPSTFYGGAEMVYGSHPMMQPQIIRMEQPPRVPVPTEQDTDEPIYVNAKQYHAILRRRQRLRKMLGPEEKLAIMRKRILNESRQRLANMRPRGVGGRFINKKQQSELSAGGNGGSIPPAGPSTAPTSSGHDDISTGVGMGGANGVNNDCNSSRA